MLLIFKDRLTYSHIFKDVGEVPYYISKKYGEKINIVCIDENEVGDKFRDMEIFTVNTNKIIASERDNSKIKKIIHSIPICKYIIKNGKKDNYLMLFHPSMLTFIYAFLYKKINKKSKIYVKMDCGEMLTLQKVKGLKYKLIKKFIEKIDFFSVELEEIYADLKADFFEENSKKLFYLPNGFDAELTQDMTKKHFAEKDNIFITVGRLGTFQKNTELLLAALEQVDLKNWKFYFIGPIETGFQKQITDFYEANPNKKNSVIFAGNIDNKQELYNFYNRSKVFVLSSRFEGSPLVFPEAAWFGNYIVSTDLISAYDITKNGKFGDIVSQNDIKSMSDSIQNIINENVLTQELCQEIIENAEENLSWEKLIKNKYFDEFFGVKHE
ncbi:MAG: glycosyltransferase family 4 protein [Culicoidibacterales bacterium]